MPTFYIPNSRPFSASDISEHYFDMKRNTFFLFSHCRLDKGSIMQHAFCHIFDLNLGLFVPLDQAGEFLADKVRFPVVQANGK